MKQPSEAWRGRDRNGNLKCRVPGCRRVIRGATGFQELQALIRHYRRCHLANIDTQRGARDPRPLGIDARDSSGDRMSETKVKITLEKSAHNDRESVIRVWAFTDEHPSHYITVSRWHGQLSLQVRAEGGNWCQVPLDDNAARTLAALLDEEATQSQTSPEVLDLRPWLPHEYAGRDLRRTGDRVGLSVFTGGGVSLMVAGARTPHWNTPAAVLEGLAVEFGPFTLDPCPPRARFDGLAIRWAPHRVFLNPPYGRGVTPLWVDKAIVESRRGATVVALLPSYTGSPWWHDLVMPHASEIRFLRGKLRFNDGPSVAPFWSAVVVFRPSKSSPEGA